MTKIIWHIGANKTGSSAIQRFLQMNQKRFDELGFVIPDREMKWSNKVTGAHVFSLQTLINKNPSPEEVTEYFDELVEGAPQDKAIIISAENLSNMSSARFFSSVCEKYDSRVILYIRRQDDIIASSWQQWHSKVETDFDSWLLKGVRMIGHWETVIRQWERNAGEGNIVPRIFERSAFPDGNILKDFLASIDIDPDAEGFTFEQSDVNSSLSDFITPLVAGNEQIFENIHDNDFYRRIQALTGNKYVIGKKVSLMSPSQRENIIDFFAMQNRRVCQNFFPDREQLFAPLDHNKYNYISSDNMLSEQLKFLTHIIYELMKKID